MQRHRTAPQGSKLGSRNIVQWLRVGPGAIGHGSESISCRTDRGNLELRSDDKRATPDLMCTSPYTRQLLLWETRTPLAMANVFTFLVLTCVLDRRNFLTLKRAHPIFGHDHLGPCHPTSLRKFKSFFSGLSYEIVPEQSPTAHCAAKVHCYLNQPH